MAFNGRISVRSSHTYQGSGTETSHSTLATSLLEQSEDYTAGTGSNQANYAFSRTESSAAAIEYDLNNSSLTDQAGRALALTKLNSLLIRNTHATASLTVGDGAANGLAPFSVAGDVVVVGPGGCLLLTWPTTAKTVDGTHKTVKVTPSASATWQVQFVGS